MKARVKGTGEIIDIEPDNYNLYYDQRDGATYYSNEIECCNSTVDWEQRRYEIAKDVIAANICSPIIPGIDPNPSVDALVRHGLMIADALIAELKKGGER